MKLLTSYFPQRLSTLAALLATAGMLTACTVGPDFHAPKASVPPVYGRAADQAITEQSAPDPRWWRSFNDPVLDTLMDRAVRGNIDLRVAVLRIAESRAQTESAASAGLPNVRATADYNRQQLGLKGILQDEGVYDKINDLGSDSDEADSAISGLTKPVGLFQVGFDASWELDLFGKVRRSVEADKAQAQASIEDRNDALVSLEAEIAQDYAQMRGAQAQLALTNKQIADAQQVLSLTQSQQQNGLGTDVDVQNQQAQLATLQAQVAPQEQQIGQAKNNLAVLTGQAPGALDELLSQPGALPPTPPTVPVGLPSTLARRRPDIRRAEAQLHAATAQTGVAVASFYPDFSLTGSIGLRALHANYLTHWASNFWSVEPQVSLPIFEGGQLEANLHLAQAEQIEAALQYRKTVLVALRDVDNALLTYRTDQAHLAAITRAADASGRAYGLARNAYHHGLTNFIDVLNAEDRYDSNRSSQVQANLQLTTDLVALYKALGGGWQDSAQADAAPPPIGTMGNAGLMPAHDETSGQGDPTTRDGLPTTTQP